MTQTDWINFLRDRAVEAYRMAESTSPGRAWRLVYEVSKPVKEGQPPC